MMRKWSKAPRVLAFLTVMLAAALGFAPSARAAEGDVAQVGDVTYAALDDAVAAADGKTVTLLKDVNGELVIPEGKVITLDTAGKKLTAQDDHAITNKGNLKIVGAGVIDGADVASKAAIYNAPGAVVEVGAVTVTGSKWYAIKNLGSMVLDGATLIQNDAGSSGIDNGYYGNSVNDCGVAYPEEARVELVIKSGKLSGGMNTVKNDDFGVLVIENGTFENTAGPVLLSWNEATIKGGTFVGKDAGHALIAVGHLNGAADKGVLTVEGGTFIAADNGKGELLGFGMGSAKGGSVKIGGGKFQGTLSAGENSPMVPEISSGLFSDRSALKYIAGDNVALKNDDGFSVMTVEKAKESGAVASVTTADGETVYFTNQKDAEEFAKDSVGSDQTPPEVTPVTYKVSFDLNGGSGTVAAQTVNAGTPAVAPSPAPNRDGYTFDGWFAPNATTPFDFSSPIMGDVTLTAKWTEVEPVVPQTKEFTVTFDDGVHDPTTVKVKDGELVAKPKDPEHDGWKFVGWFTAKAADGTVSGEWDFGKDAVTADMTLYGGWKKVEAGETEKPQNKLPQTGDTSAIGVVGLGVVGVAAVAAGALISKRRKAE